MPVEERSEEKLVSIFSLQSGTKIHRNTITPKARKEKSKYRRLNSPLTQQERLVLAFEAKRRLFDQYLCTDQDIKRYM